MSINNTKPMDIFGPVWDNYIDKIVTDWKEKVTEEDIVLLAGDLSWAMKLEEAVADLNYLKDLPGKKIIIRGNHDYWWGTISKVRNILPENFFALQNDAIEINNHIFCGTRGWMITNTEEPSQDKKIFDRELVRLELSLQSAQKLRTNNQKLICLIHYPPFDKNFNSTAFTDLLEKYNVDIVVYGHLHGRQVVYKKVYELNGITYYLSSCDLVDNNLVEII